MEANIQSGQGLLRKCGIYAGRGQFLQVLYHPHQVEDCLWRHIDNWEQVSDLQRCSRESHTRFPKGEQALMPIRDVTIEALSVIHAQTVIPVFAIFSDSRHRAYALQLDWGFAVPWWIIIHNRSRLIILITSFRQLEPSLCRLLFLQSVCFESIKTVFVVLNN